MPIGPKTRGYIPEKKVKKNEKKLALGMVRLRMHHRLEE